MLRESSQPKVYNSVKNTYEEGSFFCVLFEETSQFNVSLVKIHKYQTNLIFRVEESVNG